MPSHSLTMDTLTLATARAALQRKEISATELTNACLVAMEKAHKLNAFITPTPDKAKAMAKLSDARLAKGEGGALEGIPLAVKDVFCTKGIRTTAASKMLDNFIPPYESTVTKKLWQAGGVLLGKTNNDEFAMGSSNENSAFGSVLNPWRHNNGDTLVPGGSSGGSASAVAAALCLGATATDTGGSIRQPAAFTGTVGLKPSYGRCSRWGMIAFASSLDQAGVITRTVEDAALLLGVMAGDDPKDTTCAALPVSHDYTEKFARDLQGLTVGIPKQYDGHGLQESLKAAWKKARTWLEDAGAVCQEISLPHTSYALPAYYIIAPAEASSNLARYDGVRYGKRGEGEDIQTMYRHSRAYFGAEVKRRIMTGTYVLSSGYYDAYYRKAQKVRQCISQDFDKVFTKVDILLTPTTPSPAFALNSTATTDNPIDIYHNDIFTVPASLAGLPALSVPVGLDGENRPLGLQLIAKKFDESTLLHVGHVLEKAANFTVRPTPWWL